ncbi:acylphosphatase [Vibrio anguillarum]|nr:acylphosphatase [Vibrio anguillarum]
MIEYLNIERGIQMAQQCDKFIVTGRVQGVGFRYHTAHQGLKLGLTGYAKNLHNGEVEVIAIGNSENLEQFYQWLQQGPKTAKVMSVLRESLLSYTEKYSGFEIL